MVFDNEDVRALESRTRMISFRVTHDEFERFRTLCLNKGLRNVSEVVRLAVNQLLADQAPALPEPAPGTVAARLATLETRLATLESRLNDEH